MHSSPATKEKKSNSQNMKSNDPGNGDIRAGNRLKEVKEDSPKADMNRYISILFESAYPRELFENINDNGKKKIAQPYFFADLGLDHVMRSVLAGKGEYNLEPFFYYHLKTEAAIRYRQEVVDDLNDRDLVEGIRGFSEKMVKVRRYITLVDKLQYRYNREGWFLEAVDTYCDAIGALKNSLKSAGLQSEALISFRDFLIGYVKSDEFEALSNETKEIKDSFSRVKYTILIKENAVTVARYDSEADYSREVESTFEKFKQGAVENHLVEIPYRGGMNHVEAQILDFVARLYPEIFERLDGYYERNREFLDENIVRFDREIQFYLSYLDHIEVLRKQGLRKQGLGRQELEKREAAKQEIQEKDLQKHGLPFCLPEMTTYKESIYSRQGFDLALAYKLYLEGKGVVCNDFYFKGKERIIVVSGPNQGGKTTFARAFGQIHYLASLGLPVPGESARLFIFDNIFTHFEKEEDIKNLRGKLQDDLVRVREILDKATAKSIIIMNEIFNSTTLKDALFLSGNILKKIMELDCISVLVTFMDELSLMSEKTFSMVSTVVPENPALRTFRIVRKPADGLAYALQIAEKHGLTYGDIRNRIKVENQYDIKSVRERTGRV